MKWLDVADEFLENLPAYFVFFCVLVPIAAVALAFDLAYEKVRGHPSPMVSNGKRPGTVEALVG